MNDARQLTNFSNEVISATTEDITFYIGNKKYITKTYYVLPTSILTGSSSLSINKIGYICEPKGIDYPIILTTGDTPRIIYLGKSGIFEAMRESFLDINAEAEEELDCLPEITEIKVPKDIQFKLDYSFAIN